MCLHVRTLLVFPTFFPVLAYMHGNNPSSSDFHLSISRKFSCYIIDVKVRSRLLNQTFGFIIGCLQKTDGNGICFSSTFDSNGFCTLTIWLPLHVCMYMYHFHTPMILTPTEAVRTHIKVQCFWIPEVKSYHARQPHDRTEYSPQSTNRRTGKEARISACGTKETDKKVLTWP